MGWARLQTILTACHTALGAHSAPFEFLCSIPGVSRALASALKETPLSVGSRLLEAARCAGAEALIATDESYPAAAIVGSRDHSSYGAEVCGAVASAAAGAGVVIVSGMARGLDAVAHSAALDCGGTTIGVLGNGHGVIYPAANRALYQRVAEKGLLLSEFPAGERPHAGSFPRRNRLISGLAAVTVVIEAAEGSGALITGGTALDQGREVMCVPGNITSPTSVGANQLIRDGAIPLLEPTDLLQYYPMLRSPIPVPSILAPRRKPLPETLSPEERQVALLCDGAALHPDELARRCQRSVGEVLGLLSGLEIAGVVAQAPGRVFRRV
jgi:DNA processing protein